MGNAEKVLRILFQILEKYNTLTEEEKKLRRLAQMVRFGNGEMLDLDEIRIKMSEYTSAINLSLNLLLIGSVGRVENFMISRDGELKELLTKVNWLIASDQAKQTRECTILTSYSDDDTAVWKKLRRDLIKEDCPSAVVSKHIRAIKKYVMEVGGCGALDEPQDKELSELMEDEQAEAIPSHDELTLSSFRRASSIIDDRETLPCIKDLRNDYGGEDQPSIASGVSEGEDKASSEGEDTDCESINGITQSSSQKRGHTNISFAPVETSENNSTSKEDLSDEQKSPEFEEHLSTFKPIIYSTTGSLTEQSTSRKEPEDDLQLELTPHPDHFGQTSSPDAFLETSRIPREVNTMIPGSKWLEPFEGHVMLCGSVLDVVSLCTWMLGNAQLFDQLLYFRIIDPNWHSNVSADFSAQRPVAELANALIKVKTLITRARVAIQYANAADRARFKISSAWKISL